MFGMRFYFYSREHEPIHVHVKNADGKAKFEITEDAVVPCLQQRIEKQGYKSSGDGSRRKS